MKKNKAKYIKLILKHKPNKTNLNCLRKQMHANIIR